MDSDLRTTDEKYADLIRRCLDGEWVETRNSGCRRTLCVRYRFTSTPLVAVRRTAWLSCLREWEWFMSGSDKLNDLHPSVRKWWQPWADSDGDVQFNYSRQFRAFSGEGGRRVDQIAKCIDALVNHPNSRRNVLTTWNAADMWNEHCPITNCHNTVTQLFVSGGAVCMKTYQRSADVVCGVPHNWLQQWAFLLWLGHRSNRPVGWLEWEGGDCHVYDAHADLAGRMLKYDPDGAPALVYEPPSGETEFRAAHFRLDGEYKPVLSDRAEMIV